MCSNLVENLLLLSLTRCKHMMVCFSASVVSRVIKFKKIVVYWKLLNKNWRTISTYISLNLHFSYIIKAEHTDKIDELSSSTSAWHKFILTYIFSSCIKTINGIRLNYFYNIWKNFCISNNLCNGNYQIKIWYLLLGVYKTILYLLAFVEILRRDPLMCKSTIFRYSVDIFNI